MSDLERGYWARLTFNTARYYARHRRPIAGWRALWRIIVHHDNGEGCQRCGRAYVLWRADDDLYLRVHGTPHGTLCPWCFDAEARAQDLLLEWAPRVESSGAPLQTSRAPADYW